MVFPGLFARAAVLPHYPLNLLSLSVSFLLSSLSRPFFLSPSLSLFIFLSLSHTLSLILFLTRKFLLSYIHSVNTCFLCLVLALSNNKIYNEKRIEFSIVTLYTQKDRLNLEKRGHFSRVILRSSCL